MTALPQHIWQTVDLSLYLVMVGPSKDSIINNRDIFHQLKQFRNQPEDNLDSKRDMVPVLLIQVNQFTLILLFLKGICFINISQTNLDTNNLDPEVYEVWLSKIRFKRQPSYERHYWTRLSSSPGINIDYFLSLTEFLVLNNCDF